MTAISIERPPRLRPARTAPRPAGSTTAPARSAGRTPAVPLLVPLPDHHPAQPLDADWSATPPAGTRAPRIRRPAAAVDPVPITLHRPRTGGRPDSRDAAPRPPDAPGPTRSDDRSQARGTGLHLLHAVIEIVAGHRSLAQLRPHCTPTVLLELDLLRPHRAGAQAHLVSAYTCQPCPGVVEISAAFSLCARVRAVALRLEARSGDWHLTALQVG